METIVDELNRHVDLLKKIKQKIDKKQEDILVVELQKIKIESDAPGYI